MAIDADRSDEVRRRDSLTTSDVGVWNQTITKVSSNWYGMVWCPSYPPTVCSVTEGGGVM
jgi:hypothetical protein